MALFNRAKFYIKIFTDKIEITNIETEETKVKFAIKNYGNSRTIIADFNTIELIVRELVNEFETKGFIKLTFTALVQVIHNYKDGLSEIEKRAMRDIAEQAGAKEVYLILDGKIISSQDALIGLENKEFAY